MLTTEQSRLKAEESWKALISDSISAYTCCLRKLSFMRVKMIENKDIKENNSDIHTIYIQNVMSDIIHSNMYNINLLMASTDAHEKMSTLPHTLSVQQSISTCAAAGQYHCTMILTADLVQL